MKVMSAILDIHNIVSYGGVINGVALRPGYRRIWPLAAAARKYLFA